MEFFVPAGLSTTSLRPAFAGACLITGLATLVLTCFVLWKGQKNRVTWTYCAWTLCITLWLTALYFNAAVESRPAAVFWTRALHFWAILIPPLFFHFSAAFIGKEEIFKGRLRFFYGLALVFLAWNFFPGFMALTYRPQFGFFVSTPRWPYHFYVAFSVGLIFYGIGILFQSWRALTGAVKTQIGFLVGGALIGYSGGLASFLINYDLLVYPFYPYGNYAVIPYILAVAYAMIWHRFLEVELLVKKTILFAGLFAFVFGIFAFVLFIGQEFLAVRFGFRWEAAVMTSIALIVTGYEPMRQFLIAATDRYLFQRRYNYQSLLKDASRGMSKIVSLSHLLSLVVHFVTMRMRLRNAAVLNKDRSTGRFNLEHQRGYAKNFVEFHVSPDDPMILYLACEKEPLDIEKVREGLSASPKKGGREPGHRHYPFEGILKTMNDLEAACVVPSFLGPELKTILVLGEKKSGGVYTKDDLNVLFTLAQESAIAIENARLYDEALEKTHELEQINSQLEYAKNLLMRALKETEVANKQLQDTQAQLIHEQKMATLGRLAASVGHEVNNPLTILSMNVSRVLLKLRKNPDLKVSEILESFEKMEQNIARIKAVVNTLTGLLKKSEKGKFEPLSLKLVLEETLPLVQFQTYLDNLTGTEVEFNVPGNTPLIRGDLERLQEVFLNLFINAYHAMEGRSHRRILVSANVETESPDKVTIRFRDNGKGMTEEIMKKVFSYGFTTKAPGRGSGLGLYMCKYIIELHGGDIRFESRAGEGTTFILRLPAAQDGSSHAGSRRVSSGQAQRSHGPAESGES